MHRFALILGLAAFSAFNYAQYQGWSVFSDSANAQPARSGSMARTYHK
jgi:hypothetical protein